MATNEELVAAAQQLYVSYYGRPADPEGLAFWIDVFTNTDDVDAALDAFGTSAEYLALIDGLTTEEVINQLYQQMFNRDADAEGLAFYTNLLESGESNLAAIALDIANGAQNDDITILQNKIAVANTFTAEVEAGDKSYQASDIPGARALLSAVDETEASVTSGNAAAEAFVGDLPAIVEGGEVTLDEDTAKADFSGATSAVTVTLDGDSDEAAFEITLSQFDDTVILEEFKSAAITDPGGIDTLDGSELNSQPPGSTTLTVNMLAGTFTYDESATESFSGTISGVENLIGTDGDDILSGNNASNKIWAGEGDDVVKGGLGDDYFYFEDEGELAAGSVDGQTGDDTIVFTGDNVDLSAVVDAKVAVENLMLTNVEGEDEVTLVLDVDAGANLGVDNFDMIAGSDALDTIQVAGDINISGVMLDSIEVLATTAGASNFTIDSSSAGVALVDAVSKDSDIVLDGKVTDTFDLTKLSLSGIDAIVGRASTTAFDTVVVNQGIVDALLANPAEADVFQNLTDTKAGVGSDVLALAGNVDFTGFAAAANVDVASIVMTGADTVLFGDFQATGIASVTGSEGESDVMVIDPGAAQNYTGVSISGIENIIFDIATADVGKFTITVDEGTFSGIDTINGEVNFLASNTKVTDTLDLTGVEVTDGQDLSSNAATDTIVVSQETIDGFASLGAAGLITLTPADGVLDLSKSALDPAAALLVTGTMGSDAVTGEASSAVVPPTGRLVSGGSAVYNLGAGDDTFTGAATAVDMAGGSNVVNGTILTTLNLTDGKGASTSTDGSNLVTGAVLGGNVTGGNGNDTLIGLFGGAANALGAGNDSITGNAGTGATLGLGDDSFSSLPPTLHFTLSTQAGLAPQSTVDGGDGDDTLTTSISGDSLTGGDGNDVFTISAATFSKVFVGTTTTTLATSTATTTIGTGTNPNAVLGNGVVLGDFNLGLRDTLNIDLLGTYQTGTALTTGGQALSGTTTVTTALADARTANGGVRVLNGKGELVTVAPGEAIGTTVALPVIIGTGVSQTGTNPTTTGSGFTNTVSFLTFLYNTNIGGTAKTAVRGALADTTFVMFALTQTNLSGANLVAYLVTAAAGQSAAVTTGEVTQIQIANIGNSDGISSADIVLI